MITQVNKLIYNTLCKGKDVSMPSIGSLVVRREAASVDGNEFVPPQRTVTFTGEKRGETVLELIAGAAGVDAARAEEIYNQWLGSVRVADRVVIDGVGTLENRTFTPSESLLTVLNPVFEVASKPKSKGNKMALIVIVVALVVVAAVVGAYFIISGSKAAKPVVEEPVVETLQQPAVEPEPVAPVPVTEQGVERMEQGGHYLVYGVFSQKQNAEKYKRIIERKYPDIQCVIYHHKGDTMYLLALCNLPSRKACLERMYELQERDGIFDDMWIFTNR